VNVHIGWNSDAKIINFDPIPAIILQKVISCIELRKQYGQLEVLKGVSLDVHEREIISITGESGAGKSTLLHLIGTLDRPTSGQVLFRGDDISKLTGKKLSAFRNQNLGFIFQFHQLVPELTALENAFLPRLISGDSRSAAEKSAKEMLDYLGLTDRMKHRPSELSGGEQQRVSIARALSMRPSLILADEPTGNLDTKNAKLIHELFFKMRDDFNLTFIIVTHNQELAKLSDRQVVIVDGVVI
jgi:lipoprotein-releasing system ATP-binding protein